MALLIISRSSFKSIMRIYKEWFVRLGVVIVITSIFSTVHAQSNDTRLLLEVQSMRQEIAELRDLVERQQYELSKLKRSQQSGSFSTNPNDQSARAPINSRAPVNSASANGAPANNASNIYAGNPNSGYVNGADTNRPVSTAPVQAIEPGQNNGVTQNGYQPNTGVSGNAAYQDTPAQSTQNNAYDPNVEASAPVIVESYPGRGPTNAGVDYQPNAGGVAQTVPNVNAQVDSQIGSASSGDIYSNGVPVEERIITGDRQINEVGDNAGFDPVAPSSNSGVANANFQDQVPNPEVSDNGGGLVAVPSAPAVDVVNNGAVPIQSNLSEEDFYQQGFELLKKAEHEQAVQVFQQQIASYPQGDLVDDAYYWIAESMYVNRDLDASKQSFKTIIERYKQSPRLPDAMLKTAYIEQEQGNVIEARILLQEILQFHPRSNAAISAKNRLDELSQ